MWIDRSQSLDQAACHIDWAIFPWLRLREHQGVLSAKKKALLRGVELQVVWRDCWERARVSHVYGEIEYTGYVDELRIEYAESAECFPCFLHKTVFGSRSILSGEATTARITTGTS